MRSEYATSAAPHHVFDEMREAAAAGKRLHARCVQRCPSGVWRPAAAWMGTRQATDAADRALRPRLAERELGTTGSGADRRRRLSLALAEVSR